MFFEADAILRLYHERELKKLEGRPILYLEPEEGGDPFGVILAEEVGDLAFERQMSIAALPVDFVKLRYAAREGGYFPSVCIEPLPGGGWTLLYDAGDEQVVPATFKDVESLRSFFNYIEAGLRASPLFGDIPENFPDKRKINLRTSEP